MLVRAALPSLSYLNVLTTMSGLQTGRLIAFSDWTGRMAERELAGKRAL
jgi:hypothetical protein